MRPRLAKATCRRICATLQFAAIKSASTWSPATPLTPRARVLRTFNHQTPDRVPTALRASWCGVTDNLYFDAITPTLQRFIEIGDDVVHPVEPLPATDMAAVKAVYGGRLVFLEGIDIRAAMQGDKSGVEAEARRRIERLRPSGG